jgi:hypothetical protein
MAFPTLKLHPTSFPHRLPSMPMVMASATLSLVMERISVSCAG